MSQHTVTPASASTPASAPLTASERRAAALAAQLPAGKAVRVQASKPAKVAKASKASPAAYAKAKAAPVHVYGTITTPAGETVPNRRVWFTHAGPNGTTLGHCVLASREYNVALPKGGKVWRVTGPKVRKPRVTPLVVMPAAGKAGKASKPAKVAKVAK